MIHKLINSLRSRSGHGIRRMRIVLAMVAAIGPLALFATSNSAQASSVTVYICNTSGAHYCVGDPNISDGTHLVLTSNGRKIKEVSDSSGLNWKLEFADDTSKCIGIDNDGGIGVLTVHNCSNTNASVDWLPIGDGSGHFFWDNQSFGNDQLVMTSDNTLNHQLFLCAQGNCGSGAYQRWND